MENLVVTFPLRFCDAKFCLVTKLFCSTLYCMGMPAARFEWQVHLRAGSLHDGHTFAIVSSGEDCLWVKISELAASLAKEWTQEIQTFLRIILTCCNFSRYWAPGPCEALPNLRPQKGSRPFGQFRVAVGPWLLCRSSTWDYSVHRGSTYAPWSVTNNKRPAGDQ